METDGQMEMFARSADSRTAEAAWTCRTNAASGEHVQSRSAPNERRSGMSSLAAAETMAPSIAAGAVFRFRAAKSAGERFLR